MIAQPTAGSLPPGLDQVAERIIVRPGPLVWLALATGDRPLVRSGDSVLPGATLAERGRDATVVDIPAEAIAADALPGSWWEDNGRRHGVRRARAGADDGELLHRVDGDWRVATGPRSERLEAPAAGIVREVRAGNGILLEVAGAGIPGALAAGGPARGRLELLGDVAGEMHAGSLDVGWAGAIVVAGARVDAEALTRARATGVQGVVAAAISSRDMRGIAASEARQRASLQTLPPFAILALEGHVRRPIASPVVAILEALAGRHVAIVADPPMLLFDLPPTPLPAPALDLVRVRHGPAAGREGRWLGLAGLRRFPAGVHREAGLVDLGADRPLAVPIADLERFA